MKTKILVLGLLVMIAALFTSCDLGINPLLFDGSPVTAKFRVDKTGSSYDTTVTIDLQSIIADLDKEIDSIKVFNITLQIDSTAGTTAGTTVTGTASIDGFGLLGVSAAPISQFATERSIFDSTLTGGPIFVSAGVSHLVGLLGTSPLPTITLHSLGAASTTNIHFTVKLKLYTQVFTPAPK